MFSINSLLAPELIRFTLCGYKSHETISPMEAYIAAEKLFPPGAAQISSTLEFSLISSISTALWQDISCTKKRPSLYAFISSTEPGASNIKVFSNSVFDALMFCFFKVSISSCVPVLRVFTLMKIGGGKSAFDKNSFVNATP